MRAKNRAAWAPAMTRRSQFIAKVKAIAATTSSLRTIGFFCARPKVRPSGCVHAATGRGNC